MTNTEKTLTSLVVIVVLAAGIYGIHKLFSSPNTQLAGSPVGSVFTTAKIAAVEISPLTAGATSTSILNTDGSARWVADFGFSGCTGLGTSRAFPDTGTGLASLVVQAATTSVANLGLQGNKNYALNLNIATTSAVYSANATSTLPDQQGYWAPGTYMTFTFNATSTGACIVEIDYIAS